MVMDQNASTGGSCSNRMVYWLRPSSSSRRRSRANQNQERLHRGGRGTVPRIESCHALDVLPGTALTMLMVMRARWESATGFDVVLDIVVPRAFDCPVARNDLAWLVGLGR